MLFCERWQDTATIVQLYIVIIPFYCCCSPVLSLYFLHFKIEHPIKRSKVQSNILAVCKKLFSESPPLSNVENQNILQSWNQHQKNEIILLEVATNRNKINFLLGSMSYYSLNVYLKYLRRLLHFFCWWLQENSISLSFL